jgi:hypothetical protein
LELRPSFANQKQSASEFRPSFTDQKQSASEFRTSFTDQKQSAFEFGASLVEEKARTLELQMSIVHEILCAMDSTVASPAPKAATIPPVRLFKLLGNPLRWELMLLYADGRLMSATDATPVVHRPFHMVLKHLRILREARPCWTVNRAIRMPDSYCTTCQNNDGPVDHGLGAIESASQFSGYFLGEIVPISVPVAIGSEYAKGQYLVGVVDLPPSTGDL